MVRLEVGTWVILQLQESLASIWSHHLGQVLNVSKHFPRTFLNLTLPPVAYPVQDLIRFDNGLLLSCSYDKKIKAWIYHEEVQYTEILKNEELRCMDYVAESGTLLVGTNTHAILPHNIADLMRFENNPTRRRRGDMEDMSGWSYGDEEEVKEEFEDDGDEYYLEGMTLDDKIAAL